MIRQALVRHLLKYRTCRVGSVVPTVHSVECNTLCRALLVLRGAVVEPGSDASCQDALHCTSLEALKDPPGDLELTRCLRW